MELLPRPQISLNDFLPHVMANVAGDSRAPLASNVALSYIRRAAIRFAMETGVITRSENITLQDGVCEYPLTYDSENEMVYRLVRAKRRGQDVAASVIDTVVHLHWHGYVNNNCEDAPVTVTFSVVPAPNACTVDAILMDLYHDAIVDGALQYIHLMPQQPWTSGAASELRGKSFQAAVSRARLQKRQDEDGNMGRRVKVNPRYSLRG